MLEPRTSRLVGALLLVQFVVVCAIKFAKGLGWEILWMSHVSLLMTAVGLLVCSTFLIRTAFVAIFMLHTLWLVDCLSWMVAGVSPLSITAYLAEADVWMWVATSHHFYLAPLLAVLVYRSRGLQAECLLAAICLYLVLTLACRTFSTSTLNVNYAFGVLSSVRTAFIDWVNLQRGPVYLLVLNGGVTVLFFVPAFAGMRLAIRLGQRRPPRAGPAAPAVA